MPVPAITALHICRLWNSVVIDMDPLPKIIHLYDGFSGYCSSGQQIALKLEPTHGPVGIVPQILFSCRSFSLLQYANSAAEPPAPPPMLEHDGPPHQPSAAEAALLALADPSLDSRISLIGPNTLELLCALLRRGNADVTATRVSDWPQAGTADVAVIPSADAAGCLERAIAHARRVLAPLGTIAIHLAADPADALTRRTRHLLLLHGFIAVRVMDFAGETLIRAELPLHGRLACA